MKKVICTVAGLLITLSAVGQSHAQTQIDLNGSDTLFNMTNYMLTNWAADCGGDDLTNATDDFIVYAGGGSSTGENAMIAGTQDVAPMSRALKPTACAADASYVDTATATAHSLDAMAVYRSANSIATGDDDCTGGTEQVCESVANETVGTIEVKELNGIDDLQCPGCSGSTYAFSSWKDVLALAYGGKHSDGTIDCASDVRYSLAGLPSLPATGGYEPTPLDCDNDCWENFFMKDDSVDCTDEKCNVNWHIWRRGDLSGTTDTFLSLVGIKTFCNGDEYSDDDPIRRPVSDREDIPGRTDMTMMVSPDAADCTADDGADAEAVEDEATLGWLLPIVVPPAFEGKNSNPCSKGKFDWYNVPFATRPTCDDGAPSIFGLCLLPLDASNQPGCVNMVDNFAMFTPLDSDTRATNMIQRDINGNIVPDEQGDDEMFAYYNIHGRQAISSYVSVCNHDNSTDQIACLSVASPCSLGYAGMGASVAVPDVMTMQVNDVEPTTANIITFDYPLTRYLWINSLVGFAAAESNQRDLAACYADAGKVSIAAAAAGFIEIPTGPMSVDPCE